MSRHPRTEVLRRLVVTKVIRCPGEGSPLDWMETECRCVQCSARYPVLADALLDMRPAKPLELGGGASPEYREAYYRLFAEHFTLDPDAKAWGATETNPDKWVAQKRDHANEMCRALVSVRSSDLGVVADISAGAGYAVRQLTRQFETVINCDLSTKDLNYSIAWAERNAVGNIAFVRVDCFQPPFQDSLGALVCLDTLIYGREQMECALKGIHTALHSDGRALVDFHNWWHNPLRCLGLMRRKFPSGGSLGKSEAKQILQSCKLAVVRDVPWQGEWVDTPVLRRTLRRFIPSTRHGFVVRRMGREPSRPGTVTEGVRP